jgi:hypothetical protein
VSWNGKRSMNTRSWGAGLLAFCLSATGCLAAQSEPIHAAADWHSTVRQVAREHFKNPAWGFSHCERDYALARSLAATDHVALDDDVLFAAAYLHDIAAFKPRAASNGTQRFSRGTEARDGGISELVKTERSKDSAPASTVQRASCRSPCYFSMATERRGVGKCGPTR